MLKYIVVILDDSSTSFCHYPSGHGEAKMISLENLEMAISFAMKENLMIQFVYPSYSLPKSYVDTIESIDHTKIKPLSSGEEADVYVANSIHELDKAKTGSIVILRITYEQLINNIKEIILSIKKVARLNIVIKDITDIKNKDISDYSKILDEIADAIFEQYKTSNNVQLNILTDRIYLTDMNNCNAGWESITVAPDGKFYICPAFYFDGREPLSSLKEGLSVPNQQLYKLNFAPICRTCDAYHCKRCIWLNQKMTLEVNTPSHEQCIVSHSERNASRRLLIKLEQAGMQFTNNSIMKIDYLDPFEKIIKEH